MSDNLGEYDNFTIKLNCSSIYDMCQDKTRDELGTLIHEYTHFIQDFSTYGICELNRRYEKLINQIACLQKNEKLHNEIDNIEIHNEIFRDIYKGDFGQNNEVIKLNKNMSFNISLKKDILEEGMTSFISSEYVNQEIVHITISDSKIDYRFGGSAICESMAHLIEEVLWNRSNTYCFPYNSCQVIANKVYPKFRIKYIKSYCFM